MQCICFTHYQTTNLDSSKLKEFADDNFKFDKNGRKLSKQVENTVGKGEIARYEQFLLFLQCFQKSCFPGASKGVIVWEWVKKYRVMSACAGCYEPKLFRICNFSTRSKAILFCMYLILKSLVFGYFIIILCFSLLLLKHLNI